MTRPHLAVAGEALPPSAVTHILLDPPARKNPERSTSTAFGRGVSHPPRRRDWISRTPYRRHEPFAWRLTGAIWKVCSTGDRPPPRRWRDRTRAMARSTAARRRRTWDASPCPRGSRAQRLTIDTADPDAPVPVVWGRRVSAPHGRRIYLATDEGSTWLRVLAATTVMT